MTSLPRAVSVLCATASFILATPATQAQTEAATVPPPMVILKLDDLSSATPAWKRTVEFLKERNVKSSIGIICKSLTPERKPYLQWIKDVQATGLVEFWHHGWTHAQWKDGDKDVFEFKGAPYEKQKESIEWGMKAAKDNLGLTFRTFGAPFNATDESTQKALSEDPDLKVLLYGDPKQAAATPNLFIMDRPQMNIENPLFVPNTERLMRDYKKLLGTRDVFLIQGHPNNWDEARFEEFKRMIDFLISQGVTFTTPYEYHQSRQTTASPTP